MKENGSYKKNRKLPPKSVLLEKAFDNTQVAIAVTDLNQKIELINPEFTRMFGYSEEYAIGKDIVDLIIPETEINKVIKVKDKLDAGEKIEYESVRRTSDGRMIPVFARISPIVVDGVKVGGSSFYTDISKRKRAQEELLKAHEKLEEKVKQRTRELSESEKKYRALFEQSIDAVIIHQKGKIKDVNNRVCELLGYSKDQLLEMTIFDFHEDTDKEKVKEVINQNESEIYAETQLVRADGKIIDVEISSNVIDLEKGYFQGVIRDITERKRAEERLRESEALNRTFVENIELNLNLIDKEYNIIMTSPGSARQINVQPEEFKGKKCYKAFENRDTVCPHCLAERAMTTGKRQHSEIEVKTPNYGILEFQVFPVIDSDGKVTGFIEAVRDFTAIRKTEAELVEARKAAETANISKSEFLANMSHEIRTPLNGVMGVLNLLLSTDLDREQLDLVETGKRSSDSLLTIINDILDFSKIEAGELDLEIINFNLRNSLEEVMELPAMIAHGKGLELAYEIHHETPCLLRGDPGRFRQVILNITNNAIKFTEKGEVVLRISPEEETESHVKIRIEIKDTGIGIPFDKLETIFESFKQSDSSTTRKYGGTGLGLSISKRLVELMGGDIGAESETDKGSTFWFTVLFEKQPNVREKKLIMPSSIRGKRFLLVDDNNTNLEILKGYLESWGCYCDMAESGEIALAFMNAVAKVNAPFDAVILDMRMPGMDGAELGRKIKNDPILKNTTLIMLTSQGLRGDASRMEKIGFAAYLTKPIRRSQLFDSLVNVLGTRRQKAGMRKPQIVTKYSISDERRSQIRILIVEDNMVNQRLAARMVEKFGFQVDVSGNGKEALSALERFKYDIVLMDVQMPEMDGLEATRRIRDKESRVMNHNVPVIAMTAHAMQGDKDLCIKAGMNDYTSKPVQPRDLLNKIEKYLSIKEESDVSK